ncbi:MAG: low molecular weight protein-tyrosine-phosphatase [Sulfurisoma sp.]|nr:low molecular weight protein-tyrosine-phosphatase [Sulfurisoma sp.]
MVKTSILFVCMGNICRSPTAEGVVRAHLEGAGMVPEVEVDSAGTHGYHIGKSPDGRAMEAAAGRGYDLSALRARQVSEFDFVRFDRILAMDRDNLDLLRQACPAEHRHKLGLFLEYSRNFAEREVPDPYYGGADGFEHVLDLVEDAALGLIDSLARK